MLKELLNSNISKLDGILIRNDKRYFIVFIGYVINNKSYKFYDRNVKVVIKSNDVDIYEKEYPFKLNNTRGHYIWSHYNNQKYWWKRRRIAEEYGPRYIAYTLEEDPLSHNEVISLLDAELLQEAINDEMDSL